VKPTEPILMSVDQMIERIRSMQSGEPEDAGGDADLSVICMALQTGYDAILCLKHATASRLIADGELKRSAHDWANDVIRKWNEISA